MPEEMFTRASAKLTSFNADNRTVDLVLATETPVRRRSWETGAYDEILTVSRQAIDTSRIDGMALLDSHDAYSGLDSRLGSIVAGSLRFEEKVAIVTAKISRNDKGQALFNDLEDGHTLGASVGYRIDSQEKTEAPAGGTATIRATRWTPLEVSIVSVPADAAAKTRTHKNEGNTMPQVQPQSHDQQQTMTRAERKRITNIHALARSAKMDLGDEIVTRAVEEGQSYDDFRNAMVDHLIKREEQSPTFPISETYGMGDQLRRQTEARVGALVARMSGKAPEGDARDFAGMSMMDHARGLLEAQGVNTRGMSREQILGYRGRSMHTTSDFPMLLQGAGERVLMDAYALAQSPLKSALSRQSTANDFRTKSKLKVSGAGLLEELTESGEITSTTRAETAESYRIKSFGRIFSMSFQAIINDDLGAFNDWAQEAGRMAALTENKVLLDLLLSGGSAGPIMAEDGKRLFHTDHGNLAASGSALDEANLGDAILAFRKQTIFGGTARLSVPPRYVLVGPELELTAQKLITGITVPTQTADVVPYAIRSLMPVVEPNIDDRSWYLFADPAQAPVFEWAYLEGYAGPQISSRDGFERLGTDFRAVLHFGGGAIDYRGAYRNPGL